LFRTIFYIKKNHNITHENINPIIFTKKTNSSYKLVPFKSLVNEVGPIKYLPAVSKEWKNSIYQYNNNNMVNLPVYNLKLNSLIKGYFSLYFNHKFLNHKYITIKSKRKSLNKIFVSSAEIKHTNNKALITLYVYNKERISLLKKIKELKSFFFKGEIKELAKKWLKFISVLKSEVSFKGENNVKDNLALLLKYSSDDQSKYLSKLSFNDDSRLSKKIEKFFSLVRRLRLRLSLNKNKFEERFLNKLSLLLEKYYGKKVEFNIVNLKSIAYNSDIFTEILTLKIKKEQSNSLHAMNSLLSKVPLPEVNSLIERGRVEKLIDLNIFENKYKNYNINSVINQLSLTPVNNSGVYGQSFKDNLNKLLYNMYYKNIIQKSNSSTELTSLSLNEAYYTKIREIIFENIKYKVMGGARLVVKGRLTKRYRADRAVYKLKWKGGLKNIDSSFKGLSTVMFRGYLDSNIEKSKSNSKRRIGSFGVKTWFSGK
jgi:hypothetical protein